MVKVQCYIINLLKVHSHLSVKTRISQSKKKTTEQCHRNATIEMINQHDTRTLPVTT